jgi:ABC-type lipoprotein release transport system permease subunit
MSIHKHLNVIDYVLSSVVRRYASHIPVMIVFTIIIFVAASFLFAIRSLSWEARRVLSFSPEITVQYLAGGRQVPVPLSLAGALRGIPGVGAARPRIWGYLYDRTSGANYTVWGIGDGDVLRMRSAGISLEDGSFWEKGERGRIVLGRALLEGRGWGRARNLTLTDSAGNPRSFVVSGFLKASSSLVAVDMILMDEEDAGEFLHMEKGFATDIVLEVANPAEVATIVVKIYNINRSLRVVSRAQVLRTYEAVFSYRGGFALFLWTGCLLAFLVLLWHRGGGVSAGERKELGLLKAVGWSTADIMEAKLFEAGIIAILSLFFGLIAAYLHVYVFGAALLKPVLFGWSVLYPAFELVPVREPGPLLLLVAVTLVPFFAVSIMQAWRSSSIETDDLLRGGE